MSMYNDMPDNDKHEGRTAVVYPGADGPISSVLLTLEPDGISAPILLSNNMHAVVMLDEIIPPQIQDLETVREQVLRRIISRREEAAFQALLDQWRQEFPVKVYDDRLAKMPSKEDLSTETDS